MILRKACWAIWHTLKPGCINRITLRTTMLFAYPRDFHGKTQYAFTLLRELVDVLPFRAIVVIYEKVTTAHLKAVAERRQKRIHFWGKCDVIRRLTMSMRPTSSCSSAGRKGRTRRWCRTKSGKCRDLAKPPLTLKTKQTRARRITNLFVGIGK